MFCNCYVDGLSYLPYILVFIYYYIDFSYQPFIDILFWKWDDN